MTNDTNKSGGDGRSKLRENVESLVIAVVLALIIRASVVEAFVVPTGSMAPTIYGRHVEVTCGACGYGFAMDWKAGPWNRPSSLECLVCGASIEAGFRDYSAGDRLLVNKFVHKMKDLSRWEIIVFKYPGPDLTKKGKNYIKRLVGLPGESLRIKNGDLYINGEIERKPFDVQKTMWLEVIRNTFEDNLWERFWSADAETHRIDNGMLVLDGPVTLYFKSRIMDSSIYNGAGARGSSVVGDLNLILEARMEGGAGVLVELSNDGSRFRFVVRSGKEKSFITDGTGTAVWEGYLDLEEGTHIVECWNVDSALYLVVDEEMRASFEYSPRIDGAYSHSDVAFGAVGGSVGFKRAALFRDVYYCVLSGGKNNAVFKDYKLSKKGLDPVTGEMRENEYFMLGDNSRSSSDSRVWGKVSESEIRGKAIIRWWPLHRMSVMR